MGLSKLLVLVALSGGGAKLRDDDDALAVTCANDNASFSFPVFEGPDAFPSSVGDPPGLSRVLPAVKGLAGGIAWTVKDRFLVGRGDSTAGALLLAFPFPFSFLDEGGSRPAVTVLVIVVIAMDKGIAFREDWCAGMEVCRRVYSCEVRREG